jgi:hypothetical protein
VKCYQCPNVAMYTVTEKDIPLCLDCFLKFSQIQQMELENLERETNFAADEMDAILGLPRTGARYTPRQRPVFVSGVRLSNIHVSNSVVGSINTGSIGVIDQSISALMQVGEPATADALRALSEAILKSADLTANQKKDLMESLSVVSTEAVTPPAKRRNAVARALIEHCSKVAGLANDITDVCQKWWPVLLATFATAGG